MLVAGGSVCLSVRPSHRRVTHRSRGRSQRGRERRSPSQQRWRGVPCRLSRRGAPPAPHRSRGLPGRRMGTARTAELLMSSAAPSRYPPLRPNTDRGACGHRCAPTPRGQGSPGECTALLPTATIWRLTLTPRAVLMFPLSPHPAENQSCP